MQNQLLNKRTALQLMVLFLSVLPLPALAADGDDWKQARAAGIAAEKKNAYVDAEKQFQRANDLTAAMNRADPRVTTSLEDLAGMYARQKKFTQARVMYIKVLKLQEGIHGTEDPALISRLNDVIKVTCANGSCYDTIPELRRLLVIRQKSFGPNSAQVPMTLQLLGEAYEKHSDFAAALKYFEQAVEVQKRISGPGSPMVSALSKNVERVLSKRI